MDRDRPKPADPFIAVGKRVPRVDAWDKATGLGQYTGDLYFRNLLHAVLLRSPHAHARIVAIYTEEAEGLPGVKAVLTHRNTPRRPYNAAAHENVLAFPPAKPVEDQYLFDRQVRFVGDPVAAVAAVSWDAAREAARAIRVEYEVLPAVFDPPEALAPGAPLVHEGLKSNLLARLSRSTGEPEEAFARSDAVAESTYSTSRQKHCQMEPNVCLARYEANGRLTVWSPTQMPHLVRGLLARLFDLPLHRVRIISPYIGGGFGNRLGMVAEPYAVALALETKGTVRIEYDREEDFSGSETRHPSTIRLRLGGSREGILHAVQAEIFTNTGAYATHGSGVMGVLGNTIPGPYRCPNVQLEGYCVYTNSPVAGAFRGYGGVQAMFAVESQIDELCAKLDMDPLDFRMKNLKQRGDLFKGNPIASCGLADCIQRGAERIGWREKRRRAADPRGSKAGGVGMACSMWVSGAQPAKLDASSSLLKVNEDGTAHLLMGCADAGTGSKTALAQIAAEELGVRFEDLQVTFGDTDVTPFDVGAHASRTCYVAGGAVRLAAAEVKKQILEESAQLLEANPADLIIRDRFIRVQGSPDRQISIGEVARAFHYRGRQFIGKASHSPTLNPPSFAAQFAEVEVDRETGEVRVVHFVVAQDSGRPIHPGIVRGHILGGIQQGLGFALTEDFRLDPAGRPANPNFADYKLFTARDMPSIEVILVETEEPSGPFGAKGLGEAAMIPTAPAVANAIYHATGVRMTALPMTRERVFDALQKAKARPGSDLLIPGPDQDGRPKLTVS